MTATALNGRRAVDRFTAFVFVIAAIAAAACIGFMAGQHHPRTELPKAVQTALHGGYDCWLETEVDGSAQWYCGKPADDNVFRPGIDNPNAAG